MAGYNIIDAAPQHFPFIYNSFLKSYRQTWPISDIPAREYFAKFHDAMEYFLLNGVAKLAVDVEDPDHILGWAVATSSDLVYVYVKQLFRRLGIGDALSLSVTEKGSYSAFFWTEPGIRLAERILRRGVFVRPAVLSYEFIAKEVKEKPNE